MKIGFVIVAAMVSLLSQRAHASDDTDWTGPAAGLWSDPLNWTNGVPTSGSYVRITFPYTGDLLPVDLGGAQRSAQILELGSPYVRLTNGSLLLNTIVAQGGYDSLNPPNTLAIPITSTAPTLELDGGARSTIHVDAPISGVNLAVRSMYVSYSAANTYTGPTVAMPISPTTFTGLGSALASSAFEVAGTLTIDNRETNLPDRLNDAAPVHFSGGTLQFVGNASTETSERVGLLDFAASGLIELPLQPAAKPFTLHAAGIRHDSGVMGSINLNAAGGNRILLDSIPQMLGGGPGAPATARGTIPWLFAAGLPMTYDSGDPNRPDDAPGLRPLNPATELASSIPDSPAGFLYNVQMTTSQTRSGKVDLNYFAILNGSTLTLDQSTVTVNGNWLAVESATITGQGSLRFPGDAVINGSANIDVPIQANSLSVNSDGYINLSKPNELPGGIDLGYLVTVSHPQALGAGRAHIQDGSRITFAIGNAPLANNFAFGDLLPTPSPNPGGYAYQLVRLVGGDPNTTTDFKGNLSGGEITLNMIGSFRLDGNGSFDSLFLAAGGLSRFELNGTLGPDRTTPAFIEFRGNLSGNGKLLGIFDDGTIEPGPAGKPGRLTIQQVTRASLNADLAGPIAGKDYDQLVILDKVLNLGQLQLSVAPDFAPALGESFLIVDNQGTTPLMATFLGLPEGSIIQSANFSFQISYAAGNGNDISLTAVPEPALLVVAAPLLLLTRRKRR